MPKITIDGREIECRDKVPVLQAALEAGWDVPHYCYHPGLAIVASCRLCLMEMKMPDPKTKEMVWSPRLVPSCQTPVKDGMEVRFNTDKIRENREHCMEYYLLNHPLDCPVCDQAGECWLQDYSYKFGNAASRMVEAKTVNPKKNIGSKTLLYQDRCVMCSRCVRFCQEVAGSSELCIVNRGNRAEIDVFPGLPLENKLQGNVVDLCPVGALLDKDFLMDQRVWMLRGAESVCPNCSTGCAIRVDQNEGRVWRLKPRFNPGVNDWWMCDDGRFGWKYVHDPRRIRRPIVRRGAEEARIEWPEIIDVIRYRFNDAVAKSNDGSIGVVLSPFMACEEAWLLIKFIRGMAPDASLVLGPVPTIGDDESFPHNGAPRRDGAAREGEAPAREGEAPAEPHRANGKPATDPVMTPPRDPGAPAAPPTSLTLPVKFTIRREKCPNRRGIERLIEQAGGYTLSYDDFLAAAADGGFSGVWLAGGYIAPWVDKRLVDATAKVPWIVLQDMFPSDITPLAGVVLPACAWAEREGSFMNHAGLIQNFEAALPPPEGAMRDGQYLYNLAGFAGLYRAELVRERMAAELPEFAAIHTPPPEPAHAH